MLLTLSDLIFGFKEKQEKTRSDNIMLLTLKGKKHGTNFIKNGGLKNLAERQRR